MTPMYGQAGSGVGLRHPESFHQQPVQAIFIHSSHSSVEAMVPVQEEGRLVEIGPWGVSSHGCCHLVCRGELLGERTWCFPYRSFCSGLRVKGQGLEFSLRYFPSLLPLSGVSYLLHGLVNLP